MTESKSSKWRETIVYMCLVGVAVFALGLSRYDQARGERELCESGVDSRNVDRDQTQRIYDLALSSIPQDRSTLTPDQRKRLRTYVTTVEMFREQSFAAIKPSELCAPYVDDDNITPKEWAKSHPPKPITESQ